MGHRWPTQININSERLNRGTVCKTLGSMYRRHKGYPVLWGCYRSEAEREEEKQQRLGRGRSKPGREVNLKKSCHLQQRDVAPKRPHRKGSGATNILTSLSSLPLISYLDSPLDKRQNSQMKSIQISRWKEKESLCLTSQKIRSCELCMAELL